MLFLSELIEKISIENHSVILYGAGYQGKVWMKVLQWANIEIAAFCDNDTSKYGELLNEKSVLSYERSRDLYPDAFFIPTPKYSTALTLQLQRDGLYDDVLDNIDIEIFSPWLSIFPSYQIFLKYLDQRKSMTTKEPDTPYQFDRMLVVCFAYRSGIHYVASLFDGHPEIFAVPLLVSPLILNYYKTRWNTLTGHDLSLSVLHYCYECGVIDLVDSMPGFDCFLDQDGKFMKNLQVDMCSFFSYLHNSLLSNERNDLGNIVKSIHYAYAKSKGICFQNKIKPMLLFHFHTPYFSDVNEFLEQINEAFEQVYTLVTVKDPLVGVGRFLQSFSGNDVEHEISDQVLWSASTVEQIFELYFHPSLIENKLCYGSYAYIKFEQLKLDTENTMRKICTFLGIKFDTLLTRTTALGFLTYYRGTRTTAITGNSLASLTYRSDVLNAFDEFRLKILFCKIQIKLGYASPEEYVFLSKLTHKLLKQIYSISFDFEKYFFKQAFFDPRLFQEAILAQVDHLLSNPVSEDFKLNVLE